MRAVNQRAFGRDDEADLVERLRADGDVVFELVATDGGEVVGHVLFSELAMVTSARDVRAVALAPLAVRPDRQRQGIGSALVRAGLEVCVRYGIEAVVVLGHVSFYPRFGFSAAKARRLSAPFSGDAFMALELVPGVLDRGTARYAKRILEENGIADPTKMQLNTVLRIPPIK